MRVFKGGVQMYCLGAEFPGVLIAGFGYCSDFRSGELKVEATSGPCYRGISTGQDCAVEKIGKVRQKTLIPKISRYVMHLKSAELQIPNQKN